MTEQMIVGSAPLKMRCVEGKSKRRRGRPPKRLSDDAAEQLVGLLPEQALQDHVRIRRSACVAFAYFVVNIT